MESILQSEISAELGAQGFSVGGEVVPPVLFRYSEIPMGLVISPRNVIRQDANIQLIPGMTLEQQIELESEGGKESERLGAGGTARRARARTPR